MRILGLDGLNETVDDKKIKYMTVAWIVKRREKEEEKPDKERNRRIEKNKLGYGRWLKYWKE